MPSLHLFLDDLEASFWCNLFFHLGKLLLRKMNMGNCHLGKYPWEVGAW